MARSILALLAVAVPALAATEVALYGQCGGWQWTGPVKCTTGAYCMTYNPYYCHDGCADKLEHHPQDGDGCADELEHHSQDGDDYFHQQRRAQPDRKWRQVSHHIVPILYSREPPDTPELTPPSGDSYSQTGFNVNSTKPSAGNPLGNPALPGWTASGGLNWVGFLASQFNASTLLSYNFAYGGATTNASLVTPYATTVLSFIDQVAQFSSSIASHPSYAPWTAADTLVGVWMGVNDVGNAWWQSDLTTLLNSIMDSYFGQLQIIYNAGARNFVLLTVPPIDKTPLMLAETAESRAGEASCIAQYNDLIATRLAAFQAKNSGVVARIVDTGVPFNAAINNPTAYGAPNATCDNSDGVSCLWFNNYHPGIAINKIVAAAVAAAWKGSFF
ncbi:putative cellulose-binding GDSL lipase/acylhydrolase [Podospora appendiculata]|uniref:Cellulose-binding GDSL lipase/acylhydrolase n=1 Tax=Podospora appendiculata TaxID=314037 RepID=A0AAE1CCV7_9PEZI|nr:putative cellulose-binding GDSL lipase/acylhydrolase [Podospora appendiculata]